MQKKPNNYKTNLLSDRPLDNYGLDGNLTEEMKKDLERIDKLFDFLNALYDVLEEKPKKNKNKWTTLRADHSVTKINNAFLL